jgi:hypothetical protein
MSKTIAALLLLALTISMPTTSRAEPEGRIQILLLDAHFGNLEGWFSDRHPNLAGYRVIADETAKFLAPIIRERSRR